MSALLPAPVGVFDSGLGGLTVARELLRDARERVVYVGDSIHMPYGGRDPGEVRAFTLAIGRFLVAQNCRALVVACNTITSVAVEALRASVPVPVVGMEPGIKPAALQTRTGKIGVLATNGTTRATRYAQLVERFSQTVSIQTQPCPGLADRVEAGDFDGPQTRALLETYVRPLLNVGVDALVLGCTHYPVLVPILAEIAGPDVAIVDTGPAVARQLWRVSPLPTSTRETSFGSRLLCCTTGNLEAFAPSAFRILGDLVPHKSVQWSKLHWKKGELSDGAD